MKIGTAAVATQLAEMKTGLRDKFDAKAIETQILAYIVSAKINENVDSALSDSPQLADAAKSAAVPVTNTVLGSVVTQTPIDVNAMAINAIGSKIGDEIGSHVSLAIDASLELNHPLKPDVSEANFSNIEINANDPRWRSQLTDMSSRQRQEAQLKMSGSYSYLTNPDRQEKYRHT